MKKIKAPNPGETKLVFHSNHGDIIEKTYTEDEVEQMLAPYRAPEDNKPVYPYDDIDEIKNKILGSFDRCGRAATEIINIESDDKFFECIEPVAGMSKHAMTIPIEFDDDGVAVADKPRKAIIFEGRVGYPTVGYTDTNSMALLQDPVLIGTQKRPLGMFIPFTASPQTLVWAGQFFINAAVNNYDANNPNRKNIPEITNF